MTSLPKIPDVRTLIREYGLKSDRRCGCCALTGVVWKVGTVLFCSWCDVAKENRWR